MENQNGYTLLVGSPPNLKSKEMFWFVFSVDCVQGPYTVFKGFIYRKQFMDEMKIER